MWDPGVQSEQATTERVGDRQLADAVGEVRFSTMRTAVRLACHTRRPAAGAG